MSSSSSSSLLLLSLLLVGVLGGPLDDVQEQQPDWGFQTFLDEDFAIPCNHSDLVVESGDYVRWELPNGQMVTNSSAKYTLEHHGGVVHMRLQVNHIQEADAGVYVCHVYTGYLLEMKRGYLIRGLNLGGHKYRQPFDEYRPGFIMGAIAAAAFFLPVASACIVHKFRHQSAEQRNSKSQARRDHNQHQRYLEENDGGKETEMTHVNGGGGGGGGKGRDNLGYAANGAEESKTHL